MFQQFLVFVEWSNLPVPVPLEFAYPSATRTRQISSAPSSCCSPRTRRLARWCPCGARACRLRGFAYPPLVNTKAKARYSRPTRSPITDKDHRGPCPSLVDVLHSAYDTHPNMHTAGPRSCAYRVGDDLRAATPWVRIRERAVSCSNSFASPVRNRLTGDLDSGGPLDPRLSQLHFLDTGACSNHNHSTDGRRSPDLRRYV